MATLLARGQITIAAIRDGKDGAQGPQGAKGDKGEQGEKGKDTISLVAEPSSLVFGTNKETGKAEGGTLVLLYLNEGTKKRPYNLDFSIEATENFDDNGVFRQGDAIAVYANKIKSQEIKIDEKTTRYVSCTSASFTVSITYKGNVYKVKVPIFVDVESYVSRMEMTAQQYKSTFEALKSDFGKKNPDILTQFNSTITQRADAIALEVTKTNEGLQQAGIYLDSGEIKMKADKTKFVTVKDGNEVEVSVFDGNGLNADLINAKHVWAKGSDGQTVGHFGNCEPDFCKVSEGVYAPLFLGSATAATARFYVTSTGAIKATAGYIGDFTISDGSLVNSYGKTSMRLGGANIIFEKSSDGKFDLKMGSSVLSEIAGVGAQGGLYLNRKKNYPTSTTSGSETQVNMGLLLNVSGTMDKASREHKWIVNSGVPNGNHAIFIGQGDIAGFRPMLTKATTSRDISKLECVIVCCPRQYANINLTLPDDPEIGQHYTFIMRNGRYTGMSWGKVILKSTTRGKPIATYRAGNTREYPIDWQFQITEVWFDGDSWLLQWHARA